MLAVQFSAVGDYYNFVHQLYMKIEMLNMLCLDLVLHGSSLHRDVVEILSIS